MSRTLNAVSSDNAAVWVFSLLGLRIREPGERLAVSLRSQLSMIAPLLVRDN